MNIVTTVDALDEVVAAYSRTDAFAYDVETWGPHRIETVRNDVLWISLATHGRCDVIPMGHPNGEFVRHEFPLLPSAQRRIEKGLPLREKDYSRDVTKATAIWTPAPEQLTPGQVFGALKPLLHNDSIKKVGHNLKFDLESVTKYVGGVPEGPYFDTLVASFLIDSSLRGRYGLGDTSLRVIGYAMKKGVGKEVEKHAFSEVAKYAALDAKYTWLIYKALWKEIAAEEGLRRVMDLEMQVIRVLCEMELHGAKIDVPALTAVRDDLEQQIEDIKANLFKNAGRAFNLNSNQEKQRLLFAPKKDGGRGLRAKVLTPKGKEKKANGLALEISDYGVGEEALRIFEGQDPVVDGLLQYQDLNKLVSTYVIPYLGGDVERTTAGKTRTLTKESMLVKGRIHGDFVQYGAETGRFSSRNPNLQNIPNPRTDNGRKIRNLFVADTDEHCLVVADYSQIEPRVIASFSNDPTMMRAYLEGEDIYTAIGNAMGVDRAGGKVGVLAMSYGVGPDKISASLGISITEARKFLEDFPRRFRSVERYKAAVVKESRSRRPRPYVETMLGRRRYLPDLMSREMGLRSRAERQAFNTKIQGSAADIIKMAMVRAHQMVPDGAHMTLTVHDEIVTVTPKALADETAAAIREAMEGLNPLNIPLIADVKIVNKWGEAK